MRLMRIMNQLVIELSSTTSSSPWSRTFQFMFLNCAAGNVYPYRTQLEGVFAIRFNDWHDLTRAARIGKGGSITQIAGPGHDISPMLSFRSMLVKHRSKPRGRKSHQRTNAANAGLRLPCQQRRNFKLHVCGGRSHSYHDMGMDGFPS